MGISTPPTTETHWLRPELRSAQRSLLMVYAHPDDESFGNAGTILRYSNAGVAVHYACATRGECGSVAPELLAGYADIAALRSAELACAGQALGLAAIHYLGYRDSGMAGTADNQHPAALAQAPREQVTAQVVALIRELRPQVVLTFNAYGGYGHPDHIACHHAAFAAFSAAGDPARYPVQIASGLAPHQPARLYVGTFSPRLLRFGIALARARGRDPRRFGQNGDIDALAILEAITPATTTIDSRRFLVQKEAAWNCHRSQLGGIALNRLRFLPAFVRSRIYASEQFTRVQPRWLPGSPPETDLFP